MPEFLMFINQYRDKLIHCAFYRLGDFDEAEDIVQDVFVKIYSQNIFPKLENPEYYLYKMTMNACLDFMRKQKSKLQMYQYFEAKNEHSLENDAVKKMNMKEEFLRINHILKIVPEEQAEVVRFRIIDELSFKEIAQITDKPESTIKSRFQYAIKKIRNHEL